MLRAESDTPFAPNDWQDNSPISAVGEASATGAARDAERSLDRTQPGTGRAKEVEKTPEPKSADRELGL